MVVAPKEKEPEAVFRIMNEKKSIEVKIPFWYKPFIRFMPDFWNDLPKEKIGNWSVSIIILYRFYDYADYLKPTFKSLQKAYLHVRWAAFWRDLFSFNSDYGIQWKITENEIDES